VARSAVAIVRDHLAPLLRSHGFASVSRNAFEKDLGRFVQHYAFRRLSVTGTWTQVAMEFLVHDTELRQGVFSGRGTALQSTTSFRRRLALTKDADAFGVDLPPELADVVMAQFHRDAELALELLQLTQTLEGRREINRRAATGEFSPTVNPPYV